MEGGVTKTVTQPVTVNKKTIDVSGVSWNTAGSPFTYDGSPKTVTLTGLPANVNAVKSNDTATDAGTYDATAILSTTNDAYYTLSSAAPVVSAWSIVPALVDGHDFDKTLKAGTTANQTINKSDFGIATDGTFGLDGSITDAAAIIDGAVTYGASVGFKLKNTAAAGNTVTIPLKFTPSSTNYMPKAVILTVNIRSKDTPVVTVNPITVTYSGNPVPASEIKGEATFGGSPVAGTFSWKGSPSVTNVADSGSKVVTFTPNDTASFESVDTNLVLTINKAKATGTPAYTAIGSSGKTLADANIQIGSLTPAGGVVAWDSPLTTEVTRKTSYGWTYTPSDVNYEKLTGTIVLWAGSGGSSGGSSSGGSGGSSSTKPVPKPPAKPEKPQPVQPTQTAAKFADIKTTDWFYSDVEYVVSKGLMTGTGEEKFSPNAATNRGMIVTMLYRLAGEPKVKNTAPFSDVSSDKYYAKAIAWAYENNIVKGYSEKEFRPNGDITREQMAVILMNYSKFMGYDVKSKADLNKFSDMDKISEYTKDGLAWANGKNLIKGKDQGRLDPKGNAKRSEVAAILHRFCEDVAK